MNRVKLLILLFLYSSYSFLNISLEDLDYLRSLGNENSQSIILNGTKSCNNYFDKNKFTNNPSKYENFFLCKFSKKRNRFYIYMLGEENRQGIPLKKFCRETIEKRPEIIDHLDKKFIFQKKEYLSGFYIENFFNNKVLNFVNNIKKDELTINNEINEFIIENRFNFSQDNTLNNKLITQQKEEIQKIYQKVLSNSESDLDKIIKKQLNDIVRYKIFVNDTSKFISYSCNWQPGKGLDPYVKKEKFSEFENI